MTVRTGRRMFLLFSLAALLVSLSPHALGQRRPPTMREFLAQFRGREVLVMDKTGGVEQFVGGEAAKAYTVLLVDVQGDYMVVSRDAENDKRSFVYPLSVIRRIIFAFENKPYQKIVIEMY